MKNITIFKSFIQSNNKKEKFLFVFHISFLFIMVLAAILDYQIKNYIDAKIELFFSIVIFAGLIYFYKTRNVTVAINTMVLISTVTSYSLLVSNEFDISIFHIIVPLGYFLLFSFKISFIYFFIHQAIVIALYTYGYINFPKSAIHDMSNIIALIMAVLIIMLFGVFYHIAVENTYKKLELVNKELEVANYQKEILLNETHHRVKNNLQMISNMIGLQKKSYK